MAYKIFIVEDDKTIAELLQSYLVKYGFEAVLCNDFANVDKEYKKEDADLILMDVNLPNFDGFFWCKKLRINVSKPIIFISARNMDYDQIYAMECGGDDYITKPFSYELVIAKINAHLRRSYGEYANQQTETAKCYDLILFPSRLKLECQGKAVNLSKNENEILRTFFTAYPHYVKRERLLSNLWDDDKFVEENTLSVNIRRVRKRLKEVGSQVEIKAVRGVGYVLEKRDE